LTGRAESAVDTINFRQLIVACPSGTRALGAGWGVLDAGSTIAPGLATYFAPSWDGTSWMANAKSLAPYGTAWKLRVTLLCGSSTLAGYELVTAETAVDTVTGKQVSATCPTGKVATGAGFGVLDSTGGILDGEASQFVPSFDGTGWLTSAHNNSGFEPSWKLKSFLACVNSTALPGYQVVTANTVASTLPSQQLSVSCPAGKHATGAGWTVVDSTGGTLDGDALFFLPAFDGASWLANAQNNSTFAPTWILRVVELCTS